MILIFILLIAISAAVVLVSLFAPHKLPWYRPSLVLNSSEIQRVHDVEPLPKQPLIMEGLAEPELEITSQERVAKLEAILSEKNTVIEKLQKQLAAEKSHRSEFEKIQAVLNEEIQSLRSQSKELKIRIGEENA